MARQVKPAEHAARRDGILDAAIAVIARSGFERSTMADMAREAGLSKGALFHYFASKAALLDAIVERMGRAALADLEQVVADPDLGALAKFAAYTRASARFKTAHADEIGSLIRIARDEDNAVLRDRMARGALEGTAPLLERIIRQGVDEGVFSTEHAREASIAIVGSSTALGETFLDAIAEDGSEGIGWSGAELQHAVEIYLAIVERILGAREGILRPAPGARDD